MVIFLYVIPLLNSMVKVKFGSHSMAMYYKDLFDFILYVPVNNLQLCPDGSSWVEPVLSKD